MYNERREKGKWRIRIATSNGQWCMFTIVTWTWRKPTFLASLSADSSKMGFSTAYSVTVEGSRPWDRIFLASFSNQKLSFQRYLKTKRYQATNVDNYIHIAQLLLNTLDVHHKLCQPQYQNHTLSKLGQMIFLGSYQTPEAVPALVGSQLLDHHHHMMSTAVIEEPAHSLSTKCATCVTTWTLILTNISQCI